jgi:hypothetical protein
MDVPLEQGTVCVPNISAAGRRRRTRFAMVAGAIGVIGLGAAIAAGQGPLVRALALGLPLAGGVASYLQVRRSTCVAHAYGGTIEHDDFSTTKAPEAESQKSRAVAATILRDASLAGALAGALAAASSYVI